MLQHWLWLHRAGLDPNQKSLALEPDYSLIEPTLEWLAKSDQHHAIPMDDPRYPQQLKEIADPPLVLYLKGNPEVLKTTQLAMVGARKATPAACDVAFRWAKAFSQAGLTITSGMALGIDGESHKGALAAQKPTIAVVGTSPDIDYPSKHTHLAQEILAHGGAIVSELWPTTQAMAHHFPRRNRIISGLSKSVLVVEAATRSGSLITARMALEQNRDVFAIPGSMHNPYAQGNNYLIKQGAKLVDCIEDVLEEFSNFISQDKILPETGQDTVLCSHLGKEEVKILHAIAEHPTGVEAIVTQTGFCAQTVSSRLVELQFQGLIKAMPGGYVRVRGAQNERECA